MSSCQESACPCQWGFGLWSWLSPCLKSSGTRRKAFWETTTAWRRTTLSFLMELCWVTHWVTDNCTNSSAVPVSLRFLVPSLLFRRSLLVCIAVSVQLSLSLSPPAYFIVSQRYSFGLINKLFYAKQICGIDLFNYISVSYIHAKCNDSVIIMIIIAMCSFLCHFSFGAQGPLHETK